MNTGTQAINEATQKMADYAYLSTWFVGIGTFLLIGTLLLTWQANRAAVRSVRIVGDLGEAELRAYVKPVVAWISHPIDGEPEKLLWRFHLNLQNVGSTPTRRLLARKYAEVVPSGKIVNRIPSTEKMVPGSIGSKEIISLGFFDITSNDFISVKNQDKFIYIFFEVTYGNAINPRSKHVTRGGFKSWIVTGDPSRPHDKASNPVHISFAHIPDFNCTDDECDAQDASATHR